MTSTIPAWTRSADPDDGFEDRCLQRGAAFGGTAVIRDLAPECATAVRAVPERSAREQGPEDDRPEERRFHDALQLA